MTVHYGADIHALTNGSGFPTKDTKDLLPGDEVCIPPPKAFLTNLASSSEDEIVVFRLKFHNILTFVEVY